MLTVAIFLGTGARSVGSILYIVILCRELRSPRRVDQTIVAENSSRQILSVLVDGPVDPLTAKLYIRVGDKSAECSREPTLSASPIGVIFHYLLLKRKHCVHIKS